MKTPESSIIPNMTEAMPAREKTLRDLNGYYESVPDTTPSEVVMQHFKDRPQLPAILIMRGPQYFGMISRSTFFQLMSRRMGLDVYGKRPITLLLEHGKVDSILLPADYPLQAAIQKCVSRPEEHIYEPIAVQDGGSFRIVNFHELIIAQSDLLQATMKKTEEQRLLLEEKNREILDSIYYAERIQKAMLRSHLQFDHPQVGVFFLFRPRDIVSGDFFWTAQRDGKIYIAAVDCTGHGVPGAFMSLIGHNLLDSIVLSKGITEANLVLNLLHENVRRSLNQSNDNLTDRDGMDICLCVIDLERRHLDFSGAKRSLFLTNAQGELFVGKGDRFSIGGFQREESRVYAVSRVYLEPGQTFYLTTDGYADQPSVTNEKFGSQRLRLLFKDIYALPFADKQRFIEAALDQHQGEQPQRDDITIIGVEWRGTDTNLDNPDNQTNSL